MANVKANVDGLNALMRMLKKDYRVRVGILGSKASAQHKGTNLTNAQLGAVHEFGAEINHPGGTPYKILADGKAQFVKKSAGEGLPVTSAHNITIPARSFLAQPLTEKLSEEIPKMKKYIFKQFFVKKAPEEFFKYLGGKALHIVQEAFDTQGFGHWKQLTAGTKRMKVRRKLSPNILTGTGQLKNSTSMKVIKK